MAKKVTLIHFLSTCIHSLLLSSSTSPLSPSCFPHLSSFPFPLLPFPLLPSLLICIEGETTSVHAELFKQLIQQKYANPENIRSPFINNLRATWRQKVSKSDSWTNRLQTFDPEEEDEDDISEGLRGSVTSEGSRGSMVISKGRRQGSKSQNYIGIPYSDEGNLCLLLFIIFQLLLFHFISYYNYCFIYIYTYLLLYPKRTN
jgi:hypothetical protein